MQTRSLSPRYYYFYFYGKRNPVAGGGA